MPGSWFDLRFWTRKSAESVEKRFHAKAQRSKGKRGNQFKFTFKFKGINPATLAPCHLFRCGKDHVVVSANGVLVRADGVFMGAEGVWIRENRVVVRTIRTGDGSLWGATLAPISRSHSR